MYRVGEGGEGRRRRRRRRRGDKRNKSVLLGVLLVEDFKDSKLLTFAYRRRDEKEFEASCK